MTAAARASAGYDPHRHEPERCELSSVRGCKEHSDEHAAKHGARSGKEQLPVRNEMTNPGALSFIVNVERTGPVCERSGMEEHRT